MLLYDIECIDCDSKLKEKNLLIENLIFDLKSKEKIIEEYLKSTERNDRIVTETNLIKAKKRSKLSITIKNRYITI